MNSYFYINPNQYKLDQLMNKQKAAKLSEALQKGYRNFPQYLDRIMHLIFVHSFLLVHTTWSQDKTDN